MDITSHQPAQYTNSNPTKEFALQSVIEELDTLEIEHDSAEYGFVRFIYRNRRADVSITGEMLNISCVLTFSDSLLRQEEVCDTIMELTSYTATPGETDALISWSLHMDCYADYRLNKMLEQLDLVLDIYEALALEPGMNIRRATARSILRCFAGDFRDLDPQTPNPFRYSPLADQFSAYLHDEYGVAMLPENLSGPENIGRLVKLIARFL